MTEEISKTASLFVKTFGLVDRRIGRENTTSKEASAITLHQEEIDAVLRMNELDQELYRFARSHFALEQERRARLQPRA